MRRSGRAVVLSVATALCLAAAYGVNTARGRADPLAPVATIQMGRAPTTTPPSSPPHTWAVRVVDPGTWTSILTADGSLYAEHQVGERRGVARDRVVRLDERTGRILATSTVILGADPLVATPDALWTTGVAGNEAAATVTTLYRLDPTTLRVTSRRNLPSASSSLPPMTASADVLWIAVGCALQRLDPTDGSALRTVHMRGSSCGTRTMTVSAGGLFTTSITEGVDLPLQRRNPQTGQLEATTAVPEAPPDVDLAVAGGHLWAAGSFPGNNGFLWLYSVRPLALRNQTVIGGEPPVGKTALPLLGEDPSVDLSGGSIWAAGTGVIACLDPTTGRVRATTTERAGPIVSGPVVVTPAATWAIAMETGGTPTGIVRLDAPAACEES